MGNTARNHFILLEAGSNLLKEIEARASIRTVSIQFNSLLKWPTPVGTRTPHGPMQHCTCIAP